MATKKHKRNKNGGSLNIKIKRTILVLLLCFFVAN